MANLVISDRHLTGSVHDPLGVCNRYLTGSVHDPLGICNRYLTGHFLMTFRLSCQVLDVFGQVSTGPVNDLLDVFGQVSDWTS